MQQTYSDLISVIVPIYNAEKYLGRCIESIINQTYNNLEIILVNDGSKDKSLEICTYYATNNSNIRVIDKENEGVAKTRILGIQEARGKWVSFVDSDDYLDLHAYEELMQQLNRDNTKMAVLANQTVKRCGLREDVLDSLTALKRLCHMEFPTAMWAGLYEKELIKSIWIPDYIHFFEDFLFNYQVLHLIDRVTLCYDDLYHYETNPDSINRQPLNYKRMSCLKIISLISEKGILYDANLCEDIKFSIAHFLISNIAVLSVKSKDKLLQGELKENCKRYRWKVVKAASVPGAYKLAVLVTSISVNVMAWLVNLKNQLIGRL